jgi:hypothetical protein
MHVMQSMAPSEVGHAERSVALVPCTVASDGVSDIHGVMQIPVRA